MGQAESLSRPLNGDSQAFNPGPPKLRSWGQGSCYGCDDNRRVGFIVSIGIHSSNGVHHIEAFNDDSEHRVAGIAGI